MCLESDEEKHWEHMELVRPAITRFGTHFLTLQSLISQEEDLQKMFSCDEWISSRWACSQDAKETKTKVNDSAFWKKIAEVVKIVEPLVKVLRLVDGEILAMGYIYEAMDQAKEHIKATYKDKLAKYGPIWEIIDRRWNNLAGKMLEEKHKTIFWTPCAAHCIDLMLENICKQDWIRDTIEHAKSITKYIYNHGWVLSLIKRHT